MSSWASPPLNRQPTATILPFFCTARSWISQPHLEPGNVARATPEAPKLPSIEPFEL
jgi:hypothetical protein